MNLDRLVGIFGLLFAGAIIARYMIVSGRIRRSPVSIGGGDSAHDFVHRMLALIILMQAVNIALFRLQTYAPSLGLYAKLAPIDSLRTEAIQALGLALAYGGLVWSVAAQSQMGANWRIGNDRSGAELVKGGLYSISRHPIYVGFMAIAAGLFLATPNVLTLLCAVMTFVVLPITARLEEEFQASRHGDVYRAYCARTRRWL